MLMKCTVRDAPEQPQSKACSTYIMNRAHITSRVKKASRETVPYALAHIHAHVISTMMDSARI